MRAPDPPTHRSTLAGTLILLLLVAGAAWRSSAGTRLDSVTPDEPWHIVAGVEYQRTGDYRLNPEHPPLVKRWVGAMMPGDFTLRAKAPLAEKDAERQMVEETFFAENDFRAAQQAARRSMYLLSTLLLLGVALMTWRTLGLGWAIGTTAFLALEPTVGAHMPVVMTDLPVALTLLLSALAAGMLVDRWQWRWVAGLGAAMGMAMATKHSALGGLLGIGLFTTIVATVQALRPAGWGAEPTPRFRLLLTRAAQLSVVVGIAVGVLWAWYGFHFHAGADGSDGFNRPLADKLAELHSPLHREVIGFLDRWTILPRSYLWGLVDTIRAGVEGRGDNEVFLWGRSVSGGPPWYTWPSFLVTKVPLALMAMSAAGVVAVRRLRLGRAATLAGGAVIAMGTAYFITLLGSQGSYAGVRHALPVVMVMAILAGAVVEAAHRLDAVRWGAIAALLLATTAAMTLRTPRLWEYHNEIVGGADGAPYLFDDEGVDLGQRAYEIAAYHDSVIAPTGLPLYSATYWLPEQEAKALGLNFRRRVESLTDSNVAGIYHGFFIYTPTDELPFPQWDWDPAEVFRELRLRARLGAATIWEGTQVSPDNRAWAMENRVLRYIYVEQGTDWELVATKLEEVVAEVPFSAPSGLELGNAYLRLGRREDAIRAFAEPLKHLDRGITDEVVQQQFREVIRRLERGDPLEQVTPLRNPWQE